jgi:hypothetical protein
MTAVSDENGALLEVLALTEAPPTTLEERIARIEDREQIRELVMRYAYLCDARQWDDLLDLYTDDIERVLGGTLTEQVRGKEALRALLVAPVLPRKDAGAAGPPPASKLATYALRHLVADEIIRIAGDGRTATAAVAYSLVAVDPADERRGQHEGAYVFSFRKVDGAWKFSRQVIFSNNAMNPLFRA